MNIQIDAINFEYTDLYSGNVIAATLLGCIKVDYKIICDNNHYLHGCYKKAIDTQYEINIGKLVKEIEELVRSTTESGRR